VLDYCIAVLNPSIMLYKNNPNFYRPDFINSNINNLLSFNIENDPLDPRGINDHLANDILSKLKNDAEYIDNIKTVDNTKMFKQEVIRLTSEIISEDEFVSLNNIEICTNGKIKDTQVQNFNKYKTISSEFHNVFKEIQMEQENYVLDKNGSNILNEIMETPEIKQNSLEEAISKWKSMC
jgi:hypothetical protein